MIIVAKEVKKVIGEFNVEPTTTVGEFRQLVADKLQIAPTSVSLVHKSKMLRVDTDTLGDLKIVDGDHVVVIAKKGPAVAKPVQPTPVATKPETPAQPAPQPTVQPVVPPQPTQPTTEPVDIFSGEQQPARSQPVEPSEQDILLLMEMGFDREQSRKALIKAGNNSSIAANFLLEGIDLDRLPNPEDAPQRHQPQQGGIEGLGTKEEFIQLFNAQPELFEQMLAPLEQQNPEMAQLARQNPGWLYDVITRNIQGGHSQQPPQRPQYQPAPQTAPAQPAQGGLQLTEEDQQAIERLTQIGFSKAQATQAYIAADKNEVLAANFLLDGMI